MESFEKVCYSIKCFKDSADIFGYYRKQIFSSYLLLKYWRISSQSFDSVKVGFKEYVWSKK